MRLKILAAIVGLLALCVGVVYWQSYFVANEKPRRPLAELKQEALAGDSLDVRVRAANGLTEYAGDLEWKTRAVAALREVTEKSPDAAVKAAVLDGLRRAEDWESLPIIFTLMDDEAEELRARAGIAAEELVGAMYGFVASDDPKKRRAIIAEMQSYYEKSNASQKARPSQEQP